MKKLHVAVLYGGTSSERALSIESGKHVLEGLSDKKNSQRYTVEQFDIQTDLAAFITAAQAGRFDVIFPALHGALGEDGAIQGLCELLQVPYIGSNVETSALLMNKEIAKRIAMTEGMLTPEFATFIKGGALDLSNVNLPCVIKPSLAGSSVGISLPKTYEAVKAGIARAFEESDRIIIEEYIAGREFSVAMIGTQQEQVVFTPIEVIKSGAASQESPQYIPPTDLSTVHTEQLQNLARRAFRLFNAQDMLCVDFMFNAQNSLFYFIEANTLPGLTTNSILPMAAEIAGVDFPEVLHRLIQFALQRNGQSPAS